MYIAILCGDSITSKSLFTLSSNTEWAAQKYIKQSLFVVECKQHYSKRSLLNQIKHDKSKLALFIKDAREEEEINEIELKQNHGTPIKYGQRIQLRHIFTNSYITVSTNEIAKESGTQHVGLSKGSEGAWLRLMPSTEVAKIGDLARYGDSILIVSEADKDNCYLHSASCSALHSLEMKEANTNVLEVNVSVEGSNWRPIKYADSQAKDTEQSIRIGDMVKLHHLNTKSYLTLSKKDLMWKLMKRLQKNAKDVSLDVYLSNMQNNEVALYWQLQGVENYLGGKGSWGRLYKLRHVLTGMYLTYSIKGDFKLESNLNTKEAFIQLNPVNSDVLLYTNHRMK